MLYRSMQTVGPAASLFEALEGRVLLSASVVADPLDAGNSLLIVTGTTGNDNIHVNRPNSTSPNIDVTSNGSSVRYSPLVGTFSRVVIKGGTGNDKLQAGNQLNIPVYIYGGAGDDSLGGGNGNDVLLGQDGSDLVVGGFGRDMLIGGKGEDRIVGNQEDDVLISGFTLFDPDTKDDAFAAGNETGLHFLMREWTRTDLTGTDKQNYDLRVFHVFAGPTDGSAKNFDSANNVVYVLVADDPTRPEAVNVFDDGQYDLLTGSSGYDLFYFNSDGGKLGTTDPNGEPTVADKVTDLHSGEFAQDIDFINSVS